MTPWLVFSTKIILLPKMSWPLTGQETHGLCWYFYPWWNKTTSGQQIKKYIHCLYFCVHPDNCPSITIVAGMPQEHLTYLTMSRQKPGTGQSMNRPEPDPGPQLQAWSNVQTRELQTRTQPGETPHFQVHFGLWAGPGLSGRPEPMHYLVGTGENNGRGHFPYNGFPLWSCTTTSQQIQEAQIMAPRDHCSSVCYTGDPSIVRPFSFLSLLDAQTRSWQQWYLHVKEQWINYKIK